MTTATATVAGADKAAVLLLSLGSDTASEVLRHLDEAEMRKVIQALGRVRNVDAAQVEQVGREFAQSLGGRLQLAVDGRDFAMEVVNRALAAPGDGAAPASSELREDLEHSVTGELGLTRVLEAVPAQGLAGLLEREHPQIAALILAHLEPARAVEAIARLPEAAQADIVDRIARLEAVEPRLSAEIGAVLKDQIKDVARAEGRAVGGPRAVAEMMNLAGRDLEARVLGRIGEADPELADRIRNLMFTFEDCAKLDNRSLQTLLKEVSRDDLLVALKTASPALAEKIFKNVSSRAAEILREDLSAMGPVRLSEVEAAQSSIVTTLRELEADGRVTIAGRGTGDVLV